MTIFTILLFVCKIKIVELYDLLRHNTYQKNIFSFLRDLLNVFNERFFGKFFLSAQKFT